VIWILFGILLSICIPYQNLFVHVDSPKDVERRKMRRFLFNVGEYNRILRK
jgi:hypothetical protein